MAIGSWAERAWEFRAWFQGVGSSRLGRGELWCIDGGWDYWKDLNFVFVEMICMYLCSMELGCVLHQEMQAC